MPVLRENPSILLIPIGKTRAFIIWRGGVTRDFELKVEYRISALGNSGINYRSVEVPGQPWALRGYQADIDGRDRYSGQNYEERGRTFLALRGQMVRLEEWKKPIVVASLGEQNELQAFVKKEDWNEYHLIVSGKVMIHILNRHVMSVVIDTDRRTAASTVCWACRFRSVRR